MRTLFGLLLGVLLVVPFSSEASKTAKATIFCYSIQFQRGGDAGGNYYLDLSSVSGGVNGELAPRLFNTAYTHSAYLTLQDELFGDTLSGQMVIDVPLRADANGDGFLDFFQVSQGITNVPSSGAYSLQVYGNGTVSDVWYREAGSSYGSCSLTMTLQPFQKVTFVHTFQILEYSGPLVYTPGTNTVSGTVNLVQTNNPTAMMIGPVTFAKSTTDPFNELTLKAGVWTNEMEQAVFYANDLYSRDSRWPTNYYGYLDLIDPGNPTGFYPYGTWLFSLDDLNYANHNGIPDFSDNPSGTSSPRVPQVEAALSETNLVLTLHGDVGFVSDIQTVTDLASTNWQTFLSVGITNDPQTLSLPMPAGNTGFWRVRWR